jgi:hypothetical protein
VDRSGKDSNAKTYATIFQQAYEKAKKENDYVYNERVPDYKTLPPIERAALAKATPIKFPLSEDFRGYFIEIKTECFFFKSFCLRFICQFGSY